VSSIEIMVSDCTESDIIAEDVVNPNGLTVLVRGAVITDYIKKRLTEMGIEKVTVYNSMDNYDNFVNNTSYQDCKQQYKETVLLIKNIIDGLLRGEQLQYNGIVNAANKILGLKNDKRNVINYLNKIRSADEYTYTHCVDVAFYSMLIGAWLNLPDEEINEVIQAGLLHDIGKVKIPNKILNKKGKLTTEEFNIIKKHTILGHEILSKMDDISDGVKNAVIFHHERMDGTGYPFGMSATFIDLYSKIVAIADVFDAMTSDRVYRKRKTPFDVFEMFKTVGVRIFDSTILNTFIKKISPYYIGANVMLNNGERGRIVYIPPRDVLSPIIEIQSDYLDLSIQNNVEILSIGG